MLSLSNISNANVIQSYLERDDYYAKEEAAEHTALSEWHGKGAERLGLSGVVKPGDFRNILHGELPCQEPLGRMRKGEREHAPGIDMTFSAPKSVSIMAEVAGDERIYAIHTQAVKTVLDWAEKNLVQARMTLQGLTMKTQTDNLVAALFRHDTSRNLDPALHTHAVIANATERTEGVWRSLDAGKIFDNKMLMGQMYRSELAIGLKEIDYSLTIGKKGFFEIEGVPASLIDTMSSRRKEILEAMKKRGLEGGKAAEQAALKTRKRKEYDADRDQLREVWRAIAKDHGVDLEALIPGSKQDDITVDSISQNDKIAKDALRYTVAHLSERSSVFQQKDLEDLCLKYGLGDISMRDIEPVIKLGFKEHYLLKGKEGITTREALDREKETLDIGLRDKGLLPSIGKDTAKSSRYFKEVGLNEGQQAAAMSILHSHDRFTAVQGHSGVGKTFMLKHVNKLAKRGKTRLLGLATTGSAVKTLQEETGMEVATVQAFLKQYQGVIEGRLTDKGRRSLQREYGKTLFVLDESSMMSTTQMKGFLSIIEQIGSRAVLLGDTKQLEAVEAGNPFKQLQVAGLTTATMENILRQKNPQLKEAVHSTIAQQVQRAFELLGDNVIAVEGGKDVLNNIAAKMSATYLNLSDNEREQALVVAPSNKLREVTNLNIRDGLIKEGKVDSTPLNTYILENAALTDAEKTRAINYQPNEGQKSAGTPKMMKFHRNIRSLGIERGEYYEVKAVDPIKNTVFLQKDQDGELISWKPHRVGSRTCEVYGVKERAFAQGDLIRWTESDRTKGVLNSDEAEITAINQNRMMVKDKTGNTLQVPLNKEQNHHFDYAYVKTVHAAQGKTVDSVIAGVESYREKLTSLKSLYVEISRARHSAHLITDSTDQAISRFETNLGEQLSALKNMDIEEHKKLDVFQQQGMSFEQAVETLLEEKGISPWTEEKNTAWSYWENLSAIDKLMGTEEETKPEQEKSADSDQSQDHEGSAKTLWENFFAFYHKSDKAPENTQDRSADKSPDLEI